MKRKFIKVLNYDDSGNCIINTKDIVLIEPGTGKIKSIIYLHLKGDEMRIHSSETPEQLYQKITTKKVEEYDTICLKK